jgi:hypothetical protein
MIGRITDDGRIVPVSVTEGLVPPDPWSPWLQRSGLKRPGSAAPAGAAPELRQAAGE